jgi:hypothetical protein
MLPESPLPSNFAKCSHYKNTVFIVHCETHRVLYLFSYLWLLFSSWAQTKSLGNTDVCTMQYLKSLSFQRVLFRKNELFSLPFDSVG